MSRPHCFEPEIIEGTGMGEADIKLAAYQECLAICEDTAKRYGAMPQTALRSVMAQILSLMEQVAEQAA
jgi:hypothetical protein